MAPYKHLAEAAPATDAAGEKQPSRSPVYRWAKTPEPFQVSGPQTLFESFEESCKTYAERPCIGYRPVDPSSGAPGDFSFMTYHETHEKVAAFASALSAAGLERGQRLAVFGANCCEWMIAMQVRRGIQILLLFRCAA
jgi:long-chain acyl-CoA synthetase